LHIIYLGGEVNWLISHGISCGKKYCTNSATNYSCIKNKKSWVNPYYIIKYFIHKIMSHGLLHILYVNE
jgi:hypothetical protein